MLAQRKILFAEIRYSMQRIIGNRRLLSTVTPTVPLNNLNPLNHVSAKNVTWSRTAVSMKPLSSRTSGKASGGSSGGTPGSFNATIDSQAAKKFRFTRGKVIRGNVNPSKSNINKNLENGNNGWRRSRKVYQPPDTSQSRTLKSLETSFNNMKDALRDADQKYQYRGIHALRWAGLAAIAGYVAMYGFRKEIKETVGHTGAEITSITLSDAEVVKQAHELAKYIVLELLSDQQAVDYAVRFIQNVLNEEKAQLAFINFAKHVFKNEDFIKFVTEFVVYILGTESVQKKSAELGWYAAESTLNNEYVYNLVVAKTAEVLGSREVHDQAVAAFWGAMRASLVPGILKGKPNIKKDDDNNGNGSNAVPPLLADAPSTTFPSTNGGITPLESPIVSPSTVDSSPSPPPPTASPPVSTNAAVNPEPDANPSSSQQ